MNSTIRFIENGNWVIQQVPGDFTRQTLISGFFPNACGIRIIDGRTKVAMLEDRFPVGEYDVHPVYNNVQYHPTVEKPRTHPIPVVEGPSPTSVSHRQYAPVIYGDQSVDCQVLGVNLRSWEITTVLFTVLLSIGSLSVPWYYTSMKISGYSATYMVGWFLIYCSGDSCPSPSSYWRGCTSGFFCKTESQIEALFTACFVAMLVVLLCGLRNLIVVLGRGVHDSKIALFAILVTIGAVVSFAVCIYIWMNGFWSFSDERSSSGPAGWYIAVALVFAFILQVRLNYYRHQHIAKYPPIMDPINETTPLNA
eukprot:TRINITY_DN2004_c0_g1_i1.p1 TRINITY_DN2004_c0_g1~~TRINITY_DN2004_c0_g1_i1.p1  ORF type:complete len:309 (+),score=40.89 TRINITY_DN2004_c0_g1_i1:283-1209(+)